MKTGPQSNYFDYDTGAVNTDEVIPQQFRVEKPAFAAVQISLSGETWEEQLIRLGKIRNIPPTSHFLTGDEGPGDPIL
jgi:hypothetical protein